MQDYNGCAFIVSHDRYFLDRVCTHTLSFEGEGDIVWYDGPWSSYEEYRRKDLPALHARAQARLQGVARTAAKPLGKKLV